MKAGDHIRITRGVVAEDAIEVGDRTVIHFVKSEGVRRSRLDHLAPDGARVEVVIHRHRVYSPKHVVARAFSRFSDSAYSAMFPDSEGFASWCKTGRTPAPSVDVSLAAEAVPVSPKLAPRAATPRSGQVRPGPTRAAPRPGAKKSLPKKAAKLAAAPAREKRPATQSTRSATKSRRPATKPARTAKSGAAAKSSAPAKRRAPAKLARPGRAVAKVSPSRKPARPGRSKDKKSKPAQARKGLASSAPAKSRKRGAPPPVLKQKRRKAQGL